MKFRNTTTKLSSGNAATSAHAAHKTRQTIQRIVVFIVGLFLVMQGCVIFVMYNTATKEEANSNAYRQFLHQPMHQNSDNQLYRQNQEQKQNQQQKQQPQKHKMHEEFKKLIHRQKEKSNTQLQSNFRNFQSLQESDKILTCESHRPELCHALMEQQEQQQKQLNNTDTLFIQNFFGHDRYFCGETIPANGEIIKFSKQKLQNCTSPWTLFPNKLTIQKIKTYSRNNNGTTKFPPVTLIFNIDVPVGKSTKVTDCDVPCETYGQSYGHLISDVLIWKTDWLIILSMESPVYYPSLTIFPNDYQNNSFFATTSFQSEIPISYYSNVEFNLQSPAVNFDTAIKGASFLAKNCNSKNDRESIVSSLIDDTPLRVDSLSSCLHNAKAPAGVAVQNKTDVMRQYLFHLAFENSVEKDYISEKLWGSLSSGTLPVYFGAPNAKQHAPPNSIILVEDFKNPKQLADYLIKVANDKQLYNSYHAWRTQPLPQSFHDMYDFTDTHSTCRMCRWAFAKMYGFGWDHNSQTIHDTKISRTNCINSKGLLKHPFKESWLFTPQSSSSSTSFLQQFYSNGNNDAKIRPAIVQFSGNPTNLRNANNKNNNDCFDIVDMNRVLDIEGELAQRTVWDDNGVTDLHITIQDLHHDGELMLRLETPIDSHNLIQPSGKYGKKQVLIQDETSRITILTSHEVSTWTSKLHQSGTIEIPVPTLLTKEKDGVDDSSFLFRVRVIVEDVDTFHVGGNHVPNYFGKLLTDDFFHPLETYLAKSLV